MGQHLITMISIMMMIIVIMLMIMLITMTMLMIIMITKPLAKVASREGARPWFASRLWTSLTFATESLLF